MNEHKRVKHGHHPGDIPKSEKIAMREKRMIPLYSWQTPESQRRRAKGYRKMLQKKSKKRQRRRDQERIEEQLHERD
jgi:hypothetical protein